MQGNTLISVIPGGKGQIERQTCQLIRKINRTYPSEGYKLMRTSKQL
jgi:hypothetical protein